MNRLTCCQTEWESAKTASKQLWQLVKIIHICYFRYESLENSFVTHSVFRYFFISAVNHCEVVCKSIRPVLCISSHHRLPLSDCIKKCLQKTSGQLSDMCSSVLKNNMATYCTDSSRMQRCSRNLVLVSRRHHNLHCRMQYLRGFDKHISLSLFMKVILRKVLNDLQCFFNCFIQQ